MTYPFLCWRPVQKTARSLFIDKKKDPNGSIHLYLLKYSGAKPLVGLFITLRRSLLAGNDL